MAYSGRKPSEGKEELGAVVADFEPGGGGSKGVMGFILFYLGGDTGGVVVWGVDVGTNPQDGAGP